MSKASRLAEAIGTTEELEAYLGLCRSKARNRDVVSYPGGPGVADVLERSQKDVLIVRAELGGDGASITPAKLRAMESVIEDSEAALPAANPSVSSLTGGDELSALLDVAWAVARRAERRVVEANHADGGELVSAETLAFLNRLSKLLSALARRVNFAAGFGASTHNHV
jgi:ATP:cob(I)alamin adenosyltransferase